MRKTVRLSARKKRSRSAQRQPASNRVKVPPLVERKEVRVRVNGHEYSAVVEVRKTLADFIREDIGLTGTHLGCEHGMCGACTIVVDGRAVRSCLMFAVQADGGEITTVEGLGTPERMHPIQQAFRDHHGLQCGFCTPGFLMTTVAFLNENPYPTDEEIREALGGNLCRCTGYQGIVEAVRDAAQRLRGTRERGNANRTWPTA